jgi:hypothetical protein
MNTGLLVSLMLACGILMLSVPILSFIIANMFLGVQGITGNLLLVTLLITVVLTFLLGAASFTYLQYDSCKKVKNVKQIFTNAGIAAGIQFVTLLLVHLLGWTSIPKNMLPQWIPYITREGLGYGYFSFFASMFGTVIGGTLSAIC